MGGMGTKKFLGVITVTGFIAGLGTAYFVAEEANSIVEDKSFPRSNPAAEDPAEPKSLRSPLARVGTNGSVDAVGTSRGALAAAGNESGNLLTARIRNYVRVIMAAEEEDYPVLMREAMREFGDDGPLSEMVLPILASQWVKSDPMEAFEAVFSGELAAMVADTFRHEIFMPVLEKAIAADLEGTLKIVLEAPHSEQAKEALQQIVHRQGEKDIESAFATIDRISNSDYKASILSSLFDKAAGWSESPELALQLLRRYPGMHVAYHSVDKAFQNLAKIDLESAIASAEQLSSEAHRRNALKGIARAWARLDRDAALTHIDSVASPALRSEMLAKLNLATVYDNNNVELGANGALEIPSRSIRNSTIKSIAWEWHRRDADAAVKWMDGNLDEDTWQMTAGEIVNGKMERNEFKSALALVNRLPASNGKVREFIREWHKSDSEAVDVWVAKQAVNRQNELRAVVNEIQAAAQKNDANSSTEAREVDAVEMVTVYTEDGRKVEYRVTKRDGTVISEEEVAAP